MDPFGTAGFVAMTRFFGGCCSCRKYILGCTKVVFWSRTHGGIMLFVVGKLQLFLDGDRGSFEFLAPSGAGCKRRGINGLMVGCMTYQDHSKSGLLMPMANRN